MDPVNPFLDALIRSDPVDPLDPVNPFSDPSTQFFSNRDALHHAMNSCHLSSQFKHPLMADGRRQFLTFPDGCQ
jgi:hypothetical protein